MSTLNSSQLYVKRSSTRLHAPPGGHSSLSFGSGGFGTTDPVVVDTKDPAEPLPPSTASSFRGGGSGGYGVYNHPANNQSSDGAAIKGYAGPPMNSHGGYASGGGYIPMLPDHASESRPASTQSNLSWGERGSQPPLTSSKRDQNWEKKRRLWLARKNAGGGTPSTSSTASFTHLPPPPATGYGWGGGGYYDHDSATYNPPSPLTKFMAQQAHSQPSTSTRGYDAPVPPSSHGLRPPSTSSSSGMGEYPPPRTAVGYHREDLMSSAGSGCLRQGLTSSAGGYVYASPPYGAAPPRTSLPGTAFSTTSSTTSSTRRQPPGGNSNWNPYS
jgi:hypothetical protein